MSFHGACRQRRRPRHEIDRHVLAQGHAHRVEPKQLRHGGVSASERADTRARVPTPSPRGLFAGEPTTPRTFAPARNLASDVYRQGKLTSPRWASTGAREDRDSPIGCLAARTGIAPNAWVSVAGRRFE